MGLSTYSLEQMGFTKHPDADVLHVKFSLLKAFSIRGIKFAKSSSNSLTRPIELGERCRVAIAESINDASTVLTSDVFADDEAKWLAEHGSPAPPFLLLHFQEGNARELKGGYRYLKDGCLYTYDAFAEVPTEIRAWEDECLPGVVSALIAAFAGIRDDVSLIPVDRVVYGVTDNGVVLHNFKVTMTGVGYAAKIVESQEVMESLLEKSKRFLPLLSKAVCWSFYSALGEPDRMKQFLGFFQFVERFTHTTFKAIDFDRDVRGMLQLPGRVEEAGMKVFCEDFHAAKSLAARFRWCAMVVWQNLNQCDVDCFMRLKKVRDKLSHGEFVADADLQCEAARSLALKLLTAL